MSKLLIILCFAAHLSDAFYANGVLMSSLKTETFRQGSLTTSRRMPPVEQLKCTHNCFQSKNINTVQCTNTGLNSLGHVQWKCETDDMPKNANFCNLVITCEGFSYPGDPYIFPGSCQLEYGLNIRRVSPTIVQTTYSSYDDIFVELITLFIVLFLFYVILSSCNQVHSYRQPYVNPTPWWYYATPYHYWGTYRRTSTRTFNDDESHHATGYATSGMSR